MSFTSLFKKDKPELPQIQIIIGKLEKLEAKIENALKKSNLNIEELSKQKTDTTKAVAVRDQLMLDYQLVSQIIINLKNYITQKSREKDLELSELKKSSGFEISYLLAHADLFLSNKRVDQGQNVKELKDKELEGINKSIEIQINKLRKFGIEDVVKNIKSGESSIIAAYLKDKGIINPFNDQLNQPKKKLNSEGIKELKKIAEDSEKEVQILLNKALSIKKDEYKKRGEEMSADEVDQQTLGDLMEYLDPTEQFNLNCFSAINKFLTSGSSLGEAKENLCKAYAYYLKMTAPGLDTFNWKPSPINEYFETIKDYCEPKELYKIAHASLGETLNFQSSRVKQEV